MSGSSPGGSRVIQSGDSVGKEKVETEPDFVFLGYKITVNVDCRLEIKSNLLLGRKAMKSLHRVLKSRDITLLTKVHLVKAIIFQ